MWKQGARLSNDALLASEQRWTAPSFVICCERCCPGQSPTINRHRQLSCSLGNRRAKIQALTELALQQSILLTPPLRPRNMAKTSSGETAFNKLFAHAAALVGSKE